jgi:hypothetical protein
VAPASVGVQRSFTVAITVVVSPVSVVIVVEVQPADMGYVATHDVSAGHSVVRAPWFTPYARIAPQQSAWCIWMTQLPIAVASRGAAASTAA